MRNIKTYISTSGSLLIMSVCIFMFGNISAVRGVWSSVQSITSEITKTIDSVFVPFSYPKQWIVNQNELRKRVLLSELEVRKKDAELVALKNVEKENIELRASLASISGERKEWIPARVVFHDQVSFVTRGSASGVQDGSIITSHGIYVGVVTEANQHTARVSTIITPGHRFGVRTSSSRTLGVVVINTEKMIMTGIVRSETAMIGETVELLDDEEGNTGSVLVGYIEKNLTRIADPVSSFVIRPALDLHTIDTVLIRKGKE